MEFKVTENIKNRIAKFREKNPGVIISAEYNMKVIDELKNKYIPAILNYYKTAFEINENNDKWNLLGDKKWSFAKSNELIPVYMCFDEFCAAYDLTDIYDEHKEIVSKYKDLLAERNFPLGAAEFVADQTSDEFDISKYLLNVDDDDYRDALLILKKNIEIFSKKKYDPEKKVPSMAFFCPVTNDIFVDVKNIKRADKWLTNLAHEMFHAIQNNAMEYYHTPSEYFTNRYEAVVEEFLATYFEQSIYEDVIVDIFGEDQSEKKKEIISSFMIYSHESLDEDYTEEDIDGYNVASLLNRRDNKCNEKRVSKHGWASEEYAKIFVLGTEYGKWKEAYDIICEIANMNLQ